MLIILNKLLPLLVNDRLADKLLACEVLVKEAQIVADLRLVGRIDFFAEELLDIESLEEGMLKDLGNVVLCTETLSLVLFKQLFDEVLGNWRHFEAEALQIGESDGALLDEVLHAVVVAMEERSDANQQLVQKHSEGPPVHCVVMAVTNDHLWRKVLWCATERVRLVLLASKHFRESEISQQQIAVVVKQNILGFQIAIEDVLLMEMAEG